MTSNTISTARNGARTFVRGLIANTVQRGNPEPYARTRWGTGEANRIAKAAIPALDSGDFSPEAREFYALATEQSLLGRIGTLRRIAFNVRSLRQTDGARGFWVGEGKPVPLSKQAITPFTLSPLKVATIVVNTEEAISSMGEVSEAALQTDLLTAIAGAIDQAFIDPTSAGVANEIPASVTYGGVKIASSGDARADIEAMFNAYEGSLRNAVITMNPRTAVQLGLLPAELGETKLTVQGGVLAGVPVVCSEFVPFDTDGGSITLMDGGAIAYGSRDFEMYVADQASLQMTDTPTDAATETVSLFQTNCVAWMATGTANWQVQGTGKVVSIVGADYALGS